MNGYIDSEEREVLSLKKFIRRSLDEKKYNGFEWIDKVQKLFKIPWTDKYKPGWEVIDQIAKDWAINKDGILKETSFSRLKGRFRDALRNSNCFDKVDCLSNLNKQDNNYVVYKFLNPQEIEAKKASNKKKTSSSSSVNSSPSSSQEASQPQFQEIGINESMTNLSLDQIINGEINENGSAGDIVSNAMDQSALSSVVPACDFMETTTTGPLVPGVIEPHNGILHPQIPAAPPLESFNDFLLQYGISSDRFTEFEVTVRYGKEVYTTLTLDLAKCYSFLPNDPASVPNVNPQFPTFLLPYVNDANGYVDRLLNCLKKGFVLQSSSEFDLYGRRDCDTKIYYINSENNETTQEMKRGEVVRLFSHWNYLEKLIQYRHKMSQERPNCEVMLALGSCPTSPLSPTFISLNLKPLGAVALNEAFRCPDHPASLLISNNESMEVLLENITNLIDSQEPFSIGDVSL